MALLELDFAEFKELTQARLSYHQNNTVQQLHEDLQQLKRNNQALASDLRGSVVALKQDNSVLCAQLAKVKEDFKNRERSVARKVQHLTHQLSTVNYRQLQSHRLSLPCLCPTIFALHPAQQHPGNS